MTDISQWLDSLGLGQYARSFEENSIELDQLSTLSDDELTELGVKALGHRKRIRDSARDMETETRHADTSRAAASTTSAGDAERRQLTVMFCDLVASTALSEQMDPEEFRDVIAAYQGAVTQSVARYEGYVARYMGDGLLVYFGYPRAHEDDAERAVLAGLAAVDSVRRLDITGVSTLKARVGIATGLVVAGDIVGEGASEERAVLGDTPNLAARLEATATPNSVIVAQSTQRLVEHLFVFETLGNQSLKGISDPVTAFRVTGSSEAPSRFEAAATRGLTPLVGRHVETQLLCDRWAQARDGEGQVVLLSGEAGIGKSRIVRGFQDQTADEARSRFLY
ncbi:MAG: AAA family ATPase, partial [Gammaproteobacteria bacterium]|nr:AAA family ATPase [Gammaproteobacteria bacterium]